MVVVVGYHCDVISRYLYRAKRVVERGSLQVP